MRHTIFRYNKETCQYERVRLNAKNILWYCLGLAAMAPCMLIGLLLLHDLVINTDRENHLKKENRALRKHYDILATRLSELQPVLTSLQTKDRVLHEKFFGTPPIAEEQGVDRASKEDLLLADGGAFRQKVASLKNISEDLRTKSHLINQYFGDKVSLPKEARANINALPTLQPVHPWEGDKLISGFGMRVNPFHKGLYEHVGVDIAATRGTPVLATASGRISQLKRSDLQAGYGNYLEIDHGNGMVTRYAHLEEIQARYGAKVSKGDVIGTVGSSGGSVAPHVHYEILRDGKNVDPIFYMVEGLTPSEHHFLTFISHQKNQSLD